MFLIHDIAARKTGFMPSACEDAYDSVEVKTKQNSSTIAAAKRQIFLTSGSPPLIRGTSAYARITAMKTTISAPSIR